MSNESFDLQRTFLAHLKCCESCEAQRRMGLRNVEFVRSMVQNVKARDMQISLGQVLWTPSRKQLNYLAMLAQEFGV